MKFGKKFLISYFILISLLFTIIFFVISSYIFKKLEEEITLRSRIFAKYMSKTQEEGWESSSYELDIIFEEVIKKIDFPVIVTDDKGEIIAYRNVGKNPTKEMLKRKIENLKKEKSPIPILVNIGDTTKFLGEIYYGLSPSAKFVRYYPYYQILILLIFLFLGIWAIFVYKKKEEEKLWNFLAKETAHQIATPLSSLIGWLLTIKDKIEKSYYEEMSLDIKKMEIALERFSRIGLPPKLSATPIREVIEKVCQHFQKRMPLNIELILNLKSNPILPLDEVLFSWSLENLLKNSVDAIGNNPGRIEIREIFNNNTYYEIHIIDSGEGIDRKIKNKIFKPGITTKRYGWGIGLSLAKRIIEEYHKGKLVLKESKKGRTVFSILLRKK
ncbi:MAG: HAMP domain-containing sensor histidine kinase [candidate division WOR-3 bacterium]|nr:HAMP domain-containing histidine kinase [candidate division WOR-3 bacterium]MDW8113536.1 HAMP domain-containing sensor histidine kinase [candidate division WOR-3 bacterium]